MKVPKTQHPQIFTNHELSKLGKFVDKSVDFDLSRISSDQLATLFNTLEEKGIKELTSIALNFDLLKKTKAEDDFKMNSKAETRTSKSRMSKPYALEQSAVGRRKNLTRDIAQSLEKIISESNTLLKIQLRSIMFNQNDLSYIFRSLTVAHSLRSFHLNDIPLGDDGFELLCRSLKHELVMDLQCRNCGLTDASAHNLQSLISYHVSLQSEKQWKESLAVKATAQIVCLTKIDLRDNEFSYNLIRVIHDSLLDLPITLLDLRGNIGITESVVAPLQQEMPYTEIRTGISQPLKQVKQPSKKKSSFSQQKKKKLENENEKLRDLVNTLKRGSEIVEIAPDLKLVGPRANELAAHIQQLDEILSAWENAPQPFSSHDHGNQHMETAPRKRQLSSAHTKRQSVAKKRKATNEPVKKKKNSIKPIKKRRSQSLTRQAKPATY